VCGVRERLKVFLDHHQHVNVINCGAGFDTGFWYAESIRSEGQIIKWIDVDMESVVRKKLRLLRMSKAKQLLAQLKDVSFTANSVISVNYQLAAMDMNCIDDVKTQFERLIPLEQRHWPTCFIFECVLVYMAVDKSDALLAYLSQTFPNSQVISYEQVNLNDRFGQVMLDNLTSRGCGLAGYDACQSKATQLDRFARAGFDQSATCELMCDVYKQLPNRVEIERLEFLDDFDIFDQLLQHYAIVTVANWS